MSRKVLTVKQFVANNSAFTEGGIRWEIFHAGENGLSKCGAILRNGRKVLIDEERYFRWLDKKNGIVTDSIQEVA